MLCAVLPDGWHSCSSTAVKAFRFDADAGVLEILFADGDMIYDYPCDDLLFDEFQRVPSKGKFVNGVLKRHAESRGWTPRPRPLR
jgi:hypothetical protein